MKPRGNKPQAKTEVVKAVTKDLPNPKDMAAIELAQRFPIKVASLKPRPVNGWTRQGRPLT